ncbi:MAG: RNA 2',3'-cyclic phosphodiesterase [Chloroflexota bacterium]
MEPFRSFIAIELPAALGEELARLQDRLRSAGPFPVKWVDPLGIHLTLKFLGSVAAGRLDDITGVMTAAARGLSPFRLEVGRLGVFPGLRRVQVVWVGVTGEVNRLQELYRRLEAGLEPLGFTPEVRPFTPHLTLCRVREGAAPGERERLGQLVTSTGFTAAHAVSVSTVSLMRSQLTREGAVYSQTSVVSLG